MTNHEDMDMSVARFGIDAESFFNGDIGRFIFNRAEQHRQTAIENFKTIDVSDTSAVLKVQNDIVIPDLLISWLAGAIEEGHAAVQRMKEEEQSNF